MQYKKYREINQLKAYGIDSSGNKVLLNSSVKETTLRAGQDLEVYKADLIARNEAFFKEIYFE